MTKAEQTRLVAWRLRVLQRADETPPSVARTCRQFGWSRKTFYDGRSASRPGTSARQSASWTTSSRACRFGST